MIRVIPALLAVLLLPPVGVAQRQAHSSAEDRRQLSITVYNGNFGLVREVRTLQTGRGLVDLEFGDVAEHLQPETVHIRALSGASSLRVLEQNYRYDLLSPQKLLEKYVGRTVTVYRRNPVTGAEEPVEAEVLSVNQGAVFRVGGEITYNLPGRIAFGEIPGNLIAHPTLRWRLESDREQQQVEVTYLTRQLNWRADYVLVVDGDGGKAGLTGWVTLTNQSGVGYPKARLQLVAGDVQRVTPEVRRRMEQEVRDSAPESVAGFQSSAFFEYHLYTLPRPTDVAQNEQKQITLLEAPAVGVEKSYVLRGRSGWYRNAYGGGHTPEKVDVILALRNTAANGLGMPLPKGIVRVYQADAAGGQQFIGEDRIDHTPRDETVRIRMGQAFDVVGERRQVAFDIVSSCVSESTWRISLRNHKASAVRVAVVEPAGGDWDVVSSSHTVRPVDAHAFAFDVPVPANGERIVRYRVRVRWC